MEQVCTEYLRRIGALLTEEPKKRDFDAYARHNSKWRQRGDPVRNRAKPLGMR